jgi:uncharacterized protein YjbJ (UPF0337 family)
MSSNDVNSTVRDLTGRVKEGFGSATGDQVTKVEGQADRFAANAQKRVGEMADDAAATAETLSSRAGATIRDTAGMVMDEAQQVGSKIYDAGAKANEVVGGAVSKAPLLSLIGMAAIGYLAAFLVHASSSPLVEQPAPKRWVRRF